MTAALSLTPVAATLPTSGAIAGEQPAATSRPVTADDLVRLRDIGPPAAEPGRPIFSLSPDRRHVAFQLRQADPRCNCHRLAMVVLRLGPVPGALTIDSGGDLIRAPVRTLSGAVLESGLPATITPVWSVDGSAVFFRKRTAGAIRIWRAAVDGSGSAPVTDDTGDADGFLLSADRQRLVYWRVTIDAAQRERTVQEGLNGFRYDERFLPIASSLPLLVPMSNRTLAAVDLASGKTVAPTADDAALAERSDAAAPAPAGSLSPQGRMAWVSKAQDPSDPTLGTLHADDPLFRDTICEARACFGAGPIWWTGDGSSIRYMRREGWGGSETAFYQWMPGTPLPFLLSKTEDMLIDCQPDGDRLLCLCETSTSPRKLIRLDPASGKAEVLFDPNADYSALSTGRVERLHWRSRFGIESFGDLVYPLSYIAGRAYPLIVVQYRSRGFLRGGTGDEFPIQAFAGRGFAVLSIERPDATGLVRYTGDDADRERRLLTGFKERRSILSSIERGVRLVIGRGIADPARIGITGLSDGSTTVQYAAINSRMFAAASVSGCCWEPEQDALLGPAGANIYHKFGWPPLISKKRGFWSRLSLVENARRVALPLLMQQSDDEYRGSLGSFTALRQAGKPVALYVFADEHHVKWQPAHRLAVYARNLAWFDYWLRGVGTADPALGTTSARTSTMGVATSNVVAH